MCDLAKSVTHWYTVVPHCRRAALQGRHSGISGCAVSSTACVQGHSNRIQESVGQSSGVLQQWPRRVVASWSTLGPRKQLDGYSRLSQTKPARGLLSPTRFSNTCAPSADRLRHSERLVRVRCSHVSQRWVPSTPLQAHVARCSGKVVPQPELR